MLRPAINLFHEASAYLLVMAKHGLIRLDLENVSEVDILEL